MIATEPPAAAPTIALDRRSLLKSGALFAGLAASPLSAHGEKSGFAHGVASGEPGADRVLLWTRFGAAQDTELDWQVSPTLDFARVISEGKVTASPGRDWCCKAWAKGLSADSWYYYRFVAPDGTVSPIGRTRTLPTGETARWRMAVFSCSNIGFGYFNAYAHAAQADEFDLVVHTGDYLYEYGRGTYPSTEQALAARALNPATETVSLADYRHRHANYRRDSDLQRLTQLYPMIAGWDDHESTNDSHATGAQNHQPGTEGSWDVRKAAAARAYREWMPVSDEPWATYEVGNLATLIRLETRLIARDEQLDLQSVIRGRSGEDLAKALVAFRENDWQDDSREVIGGPQMRWMADRLNASVAAGKPWQVLAQQVLMGKLSTPASIASAITDDMPGYIRDRLRAGIAAAKVGLPLNMDAWDGYPAERARVFKAALEANANLISLAGDTHNAWAFDLSHEGERVGVEFGGHSVTSPGVEGYLPQISAPDFARAAVGDNPELKWMEASRRGYMAVELTPMRATSEFRFMSGIRTRSTALAGMHRETVEVGQRKLSG